MSTRNSVACLVDVILPVFHIKSTLGSRQQIILCLPMQKKDFVENEVRKGDSEGVSKVILSEWLDM